MKIRPHDEWHGEYDIDDPTTRVEDRDDDWYAGVIGESHDYYHELTTDADYCKVLEEEPDGYFERPDPRITFEWQCRKRHRRELHNAWRSAARRALGSGPAVQILTGWFVQQHATGFDVRLVAQHSSGASVSTDLFRTTRVSDTLVKLYDNHPCCAVNQLLDRVAAANRYMSRVVTGQSPDRRRIQAARCEVDDALDTADERFDEAVGAGVDQNAAAVRYLNTVADCVETLLAAEGWCLALRRTHRYDRTVRLTVRPKTDLLIALDLDSEVGDTSFGAVFDTARPRDLADAIVHVGKTGNPVCGDFFRAHLLPAP